MDGELGERSKTIKRVARLRERRWRRQTGLFLAEGEHCVEEAKKAGLVKEIYSLRGWEGERKITPGALRKLTSLTEPKDLVAVCKMPSFKREIGERVLLFEQIDNPGNLGVICRNAIAFGFEDIIYSGVDSFNPKVVQSSQGALFSVNIIKTDDIKRFLVEELKDYKKVATVTPSTANSIDIRGLGTDWGRVVYIFGNESKGLSEGLLSHADIRVHIPCNFESLSVVNAVAIFCFWHNYIGDV